MSLLLLVNPKAGVGAPAQTVSPGLINNAPVLHAPSIDQAVDVGLIDNAPAVFAPTVTQSVEVGIIANGSTVFAPTITDDGPQTVSVGLIGNGHHIYAPALTQFWVRDVGTHSGRGPKHRRITRIHSGRGTDTEPALVDAGVGGYPYGYEGGY